MRRKMLIIAVILAVSAVAAAWVFWPAPRPLLRKGMTRTEFDQAIGNWSAVSNRARPLGNGREEEIMDIISYRDWLGQRWAGRVIFLREPGAKEDVLIEWEESSSPPRECPPWLEEIAQKLGW